MIADMYYMFTGVSILLFVLIVLFTEDEYIKTDKTGREYDANIFIVVPLTVLNMIMIILLAFQSWNVEMYDPTIQDYVVYQYDYMVLVFYGFFLINLALMVKKVFDFFINVFYESSVNKKWKQ